MDINKILKKILNESCPSIRLRTRVDLLQEDETGQNMAALQQEIMKDEGVRFVFSQRKADGWLGDGFHGSCTKAKTYVEGHLRFLYEKGVNKKHTIIEEALQRMELSNEEFYHVIQEKGDHLPISLDRNGASGALMMRACLFGQAGREDKVDVKEQIEFALGAFQTVLGVDSALDITEEHRGKTVFKQGKYWPCLYHVRLLACTRSWRTPENRNMIIKSLNKLSQLLPFNISSVYIRGINGQLIAPAQAFTGNLIPDMLFLKDYQWFSWFHYMELFSRLEITEAVPALKKQVEDLYDTLNVNEGWFTLKPESRYFFLWGAYSGLALEKDWKSPCRREFDLTFRSFLILKNAGILKF